jgi:formate hydrogenlyase subunit 3/multisubunit Na+/H+ antiporter MnhD subunit
MPVTFLALGLGGLSLMGLPPSGGFAAKWLLLRASVASGQWVFTLVMLTGGLLAAGYVFRILSPALAEHELVLKSPPQRSREGAALALAVVAVVLGFAPPEFFDFLQIGRLAVEAQP